MHVKSRDYVTAITYIYSFWYGNFYYFTVMTIV